MKFRFGQHLIDILRGKKEGRSAPRSVTTGSFETKMVETLNVCSRFRYPETKEDYIPDFSKPVLVEINKAKVKYDLKKALKKIRKLGIEKLAESYNSLSDEHSKEMMLKVLAYNCFDEPRLRFPIFYSPCLQMQDVVADCALDDEVIILWNGLVKLKKCDLSKLGYNIRLWQNTVGVVIDFIEEQYKYKKMVVAEKGDVVIDAGACYGDTALYFSEKTGGADVYSFEFLPENVDIFSKNMELNPKYKDSVHLVKKPVSDTSGMKLYAVPNGPGTSVTSFKQENAIEFETITIDDFVEQNSISKVDFIKMDIEGSEEAALKGAEKTIKKFRPKLAICAYHKVDDLCVLPHIIKAMVPEYKLYLDHYTINSTETVLFARA